MRRKDREITDRRAIDAIIRASRVCRLALCDGGAPYLVPLCFGYDGSHLYFHSADQGRKIDIIQRSPRVCFELDILHGIVASDQPCGWGMRYESVVGFGMAEILCDPREKAQALGWIMKQYGGPQGPFPESSLEKTLVIRVAIQEITGKCHD
jgi:hypothetical protein